LEKLFSSYTNETLVKNVKIVLISASNILLRQALQLKTLLTNWNKEAKIKCTIDFNKICQDRDKNLELVFSKSGSVLNIWEDFDD